MLSLAYILPNFTGNIPQIGNMLLPMHLPTILCGYLCGGPWGAAVGFIAPLMRSAILGMPPPFPTAISMAVEMAVYGFVSGFLYRRLPKTLGGIYASLISAMLIGRVVWGRCPAHPASPPAVRNFPSPPLSPVPLPTPSPASSSNWWPSPSSFWPFSEPI